MAGNGVLPRAKWFSPQTRAKKTLGNVGGVNEKQETTASGERPEKAVVCGGSTLNADVAREKKNTRILIGSQSGQNDITKENGMVTRHTKMGHTKKKDNRRTVASQRRKPARHFWEKQGGIKHRERR